MNGEERQNYRRAGQERRYRYAAREKRRKKRILHFLWMGISVFVFIFSIVQLIGYIGEYRQTQKNAEELRRIYYEETPATISVVTAEPVYTSRPTAVPVVTPIPALGIIPAKQQSVQTLPTVRYPGNASAHVSSRFEKLQRQNRDIIGWLSIDELVDEAVVQRDNSYYLRRDYRGYHNNNGAIFLDENCKLKTRPYTLILYGHNMKTGAMFGGLRNYENIVYLKNSPFITFDTAYENGRYVIFSVATVSTKSADSNFLDFIKLQSANFMWRQEALQSLERLSLFSNHVDVKPEDQILLLVTCVDDEDERRVIAARRIRDGESESALKSAVGQNRKK